jgi:hypothetical protein
VPPRLAQFVADLAVDLRIDLQADADEQTLNPPAVIRKRAGCGLAVPHNGMVHKAKAESQPLPRLLRIQRRIPVAKLDSRGFAPEVGQIQGAVAVVVAQALPKRPQRVCAVQNLRRRRHGAAEVRVAAAGGYKAEENLVVAVEEIPEASDVLYILLHLREAEVNMAPAGGIDSRAEVAADIERLGDEVFPFVVGQHSSFDLDGYPADARIAALTLDAHIDFDRHVGMQGERIVRIGTGARTDPVGGQHFSQHPLYVHADAAADEGNGHLVFCADSPRPIENCFEQRGSLVGTSQGTIASAGEIAAFFKFHWQKGVDLGYPTSGGRAVVVPNKPLPNLPIPWLSVSPLAMDLMLASGLDPLTLLGRQRGGDWGEVNGLDRKLNEDGIREGNALLGLYPTKLGQPIVLLTEANHLFAHLSALEETHVGRDLPRVDREQVDYMKNIAGTPGKFPLGTVVFTPGAIDALLRSGETPTPMLKRHVAGDWGDVPEDDKQANERALHDGERLLSSYKTKLGDKLWIITEADRESTTMLLPEEY